MIPLTYPGRFLGVPIGRVMLVRIGPLLSANCTADFDLAPPLTAATPNFRVAGDMLFAPQDLQ